MENAQDTAARHEQGAAFAVSAMVSDAERFVRLRLAGLELHLQDQDHDPMPMIPDDLLVHFDDGRAANALRALAHFGQSSQVILFTHHAHVLELARTNLEAGEGPSPRPIRGAQRRNRRGRQSLPLPVCRRRARWRR